MDEDLDRMSREELIAEARKLRQGIRVHRDSSGQELCWHHPALWALLPEPSDPLPTVPDWPRFMHGCIRYRQSLDEQLPHAPRSARPVQEKLSVARLRNYTGWLIIIPLIVVISLTLWSRLQQVVPPSVFGRLALGQFPAMLGIHVASAISLFVVLVLRISTGPVETEFGAFKFRGAGAQIVFWLLCFLAVIGAMKLLWLSSAESRAFIELLCADSTGSRGAACP